MDLKSVRITVIGAGISGLSAAKLASHVGANVFVSDSKDSDSLQRKLGDFRYETGGHTPECLKADLMILSPGIPSNSAIVRDFRSHGIKIVSEIEFASWLTDSKIIAITGSNGKTTTTTLVSKILIAAGIKTYLGGNVGVPFSLNVLDELQNKVKEPTHVLELSSFQLENIDRFCPEIACILNISPDHLDRYDGMSEYITAKLRIAGLKRSAQWFVYNGHDQYLRENIRPAKSHIPFSSVLADQGQLYTLEGDTIQDKDNQKLLALSETHLLGRHNADNILAAMTIAELAGVKGVSMVKTIKNFKPIEHRLEFVDEVNSVRYYNDSKATNIESTVASIASFDKNIILILGGQDKGNSDFRVLIAPMKNRVQSIVSYGAAGREIADQLNDHFSIVYRKKFEDCFSTSVEIAKKGSVVLLAPACASYDQFENFEQRGTKFKTMVKDLRRLSFAS